MAEMDSGLQKLSHADDCHGLSPFLLVWMLCCRWKPGGTGRRLHRHRHPADPPDRRTKLLHLTNDESALELRFVAADADECCVEAPPVTSESLAHLADEIRAEAWDLALSVVSEGLRDDTIPPLARLGRIGQLGDMPTFIGELAEHLVHPRPERLRRGSQLAALVRDHAREREALGFAPRDIVTEFLVLRRVLWRLVRDRSAMLEASDVFVLEERLHDVIDSLVTECVVAYFDRATSELSYRARHDALTELLNHASFTRELELELERAKRYGSGVTLVFFDLDDFKELNDSRGHQAGDQALKQVAQLLRKELRQSDLAGRMGGDEFAALLVESGRETGEAFLDRLNARLGELPDPIGMSAGVTRFPDDGDDAEALFALADMRLYEAKRANAA
jgi:diguanylate cyclase (GGDEF)-like protein